MIGYGGNSNVLTIPNEVKRIRSSAFRYSNIKEVIIPGGATRISDGAFYNCTSLKSITIPDSVVEISDSVFEDCPNLTIYASSGSEMGAYAKEYDISFVAE